MTKSYKGILEKLANRIKIYICNEYSAAASLGLITCYGVFRIDFVTSRGSRRAINLYKTNVKKVHSILIAIVGKSTHLSCLRQ